MESQPKRGSRKSRLRPSPQLTKALRSRRRRSQRALGLASERCREFETWFSPAIDNACSASARAVSRIESPNGFALLPQTYTLIRCDFVVNNRVMSALLWRPIQDAPHHSMLAEAP